MSEIKIAILSVIGFFLLLFAAFLTYRYNQTRNADLVFPGGTTYLGATPTPIPTNLIK